MKTIILTKKLIDGEKLKKSLITIDPVFMKTECITKKDILVSKEKFSMVEIIFSTWYMPEFTESEIKDYFPSLKAIFYSAGTVKYFAKPFLKNNIKIYSASKANGIPVAEFVAAQIILANKGYFQAQKECHKSLWKLGYRNARSIANSKAGNFNAKIGIVGCGNVGSHIVKILKKYELDIYIYDPYLTPTDIAELGVKSVSLDEIISRCDVITNHLPDIQETKNVFNYSLLSKMKDNATFINTGRGAQIVENDLARVMREKPNACALLDVTRHEPVLPCSSLLRRKNIFITPHIAGSMSGEFERMVRCMFLAFKDFSEGRKSDFEINLEQLSKQT